MTIYGLVSGLLGLIFMVSVIGCWPLPKKQPKNIASSSNTQPDLYAWKRANRTDALRKWDQEFTALLPPKPPCENTDHDHVEIVAWGGATITRICS